MKKLVFLAVAPCIMIAASLPVKAQMFEMGATHLKAGGLGAGAAGAVAATSHAKLTVPQREALEKEISGLSTVAGQKEKQGKFTDAADAYVKLASQSEKLRGAKHESVGASWAKAGELYGQAKQHSKAEECFRAQMKAVAASSGSSSPLVIPVLKKLSDACMNGGNFEEADAYGTQMLGMSEKHFGPNDSRTEEARQKLAATLKTYASKMREYGDENQAKSIEERATKLTPVDTSQSAVKPPQ